MIILPSLQPKQWICILQQKMNDWYIYLINMRWWIDVQDYQETICVRWCQNQIHYGDKNKNYGRRTKSGKIYKTYYLNCYLIICLENVFEAPPNDLYRSYPVSNPIQNIHMCLLGLINKESYFLLLHDSSSTSSLFCMYHSYLS